MINIHVQAKKQGVESVITSGSPSSINMSASPSRSSDDSSVASALSSESSASGQLELLPTTTRSNKRKRDVNTNEGESDPPVLSHASLRKQKKLVDGASQPVPKSTVVPVPGSQKRQHSIWVGNLSFKTSETDIREFFQFAGEVTRIHLPSKVADRSQHGKPQNRG